MESAFPGKLKVFTVSLTGRDGEQRFASGAVLPDG